MKKVLFLVVLFTACQKETATESQDRIPKYDITSTCYDGMEYNVEVYFRNCQNSDTQICVYTVRGKGVDSAIALGINGIHHIQFITNRTDAGGISVYVRNADTLYPSKTKILTDEICN